MKNVKNEVLENWIDLLMEENLDSTPPTELVEEDWIDYLINEIKTQKKVTYENPTTGNLVSLLEWHNSLLSEVEKKKAS